MLRFRALHQRGGILVRSRGAANELQVERSHTHSSRSKLLITQTSPSYKRTYHTLPASSTFLPDTRTSLNSWKDPKEHTGILQHYQTHITRSKVFVSKHNKSVVTAEQIIETCSHYGIPEADTQRKNKQVIIKECPFCPKPTNNEASNQNKLYINVGAGGGAYFCHRCGAKGSWYDFKRNLGGFEVVSAGGGSSGPSPQASRLPQGAFSPQRAASSQRSRTSSFSDPASVPCLPMPSQRLAATYISSLVDQPIANPVLDYLLQTRGLDKATLRKYGVGRATYNFPSKQKGSSGQYVAAECVTFPWIIQASQVVDQEALRGATYNYEKENEKENDEEGGDPHVTRRIKARAIQEKSWQRLDPPGGGWGLFGLHTVPKDAKEIIITEGEYDAMAVYQATGRPAVSLPNGCRSLPVEVLPLLEDFDTIYLWMDNDGPGQEGAEKFAKKIGMNRCLIVQPEQGTGAPKDANEALLGGHDLNEILKLAKPLSHESILDFGDLRDQVLHEIIHPDKYVGVAVPSLEQFTKIIKGFRRGEMTVITGPTGSGKTTFLGQMSLDFAEQGVNTLWGSFEIKNTRLMHKLLQQFSREPLPAGKPEMAPALEALADRFQALPLYFMKFHGGSEVDDVIDAMDYAVYVHDVEHIILDNMQFMISRNSSSGGSSYDKFDTQDMAVEKFRKFATEHNVHVTLVVHPRKEDEGAKLGISSIYGSAKATQEADTVLILQSDGKRKYIEVKKNRFDGTLGFSPLHFQRASGRYMEQPEVGGGDAPKPPRPAVVGAGPRTVKASPLKAAGGSTSTPSNLENHWDSILSGAEK